MKNGLVASASDLIRYGFRFGRWGLLVSEHNKNAKKNEKRQKLLKQSRENHSKRGWK